MIHYNCSHSYKHIIIYNASMYDRIVSDAYIISNNSGRFHIRAVYNCPVLYIYLIAHAYAVYVPPYY